MLEFFFSYQLPTIKSARELANELSKRAVLLRDLAAEQLKEDLEKTEEENKTSVYDFYLGFKELIKDAKIEDCVDAYAQTITYGLFLSKIESKDQLDRKTAISNIPSSIKIIKKIFMNITGDMLPSNVSWIVDEIVDVLNASDIKSILSFEFHINQYKDPFMHFYEDFLSYYDPKKRKHLGVYYTPEPIVSFITCSIDKILKKDFNKPMGYAENSITVLDPAVGTGTFLANSFLLSIKNIKKGLGGVLEQKIRNHLLKNFYGFELLVSPYVISHLKLSLLLNKEGYDLKEEDRIQVYLTNTLDPTEVIHTIAPFLSEINKETITANKIKLEKPILVVMGNPPYSKSSSNKSEWIMKKINDYKKDLRERNIQPLDDDYIKFIRFAQWKIDKNESGILGFITNNSYLDGIIHRQMRKELLNTFDRIFILNLHGDARRDAEVIEGKDENVFDIRQGVSIGIFIKNNKFKDKKVFYSDLIGSRKSKYEFLEKNDIFSFEWRELELERESLFFIPKDYSSQEKYNKYWKITDIFKEYTSGVKTHRDHFIIDFDKDKLKNKLNKFLDKSLSDKEVKELFRLNDSIDWIKNVRNKINQEGLKEYMFKDYNFRPFDIRWIYYSTYLITRHRYKLMKNLLKDNLSLILRRTCPNGWRHIFITDKITDINFLKAQSYVFPLYIFNRNNKNINQKTFTGRDIEIKKGKQVNFTQEFMDFIQEQYQNKLSPEDILSYIYTILHSSKYRKKYEEFLKIDFPRVPFVKDYNNFIKISQLGKKLIELHLMKEVFKKNIAKFNIQGSNRIMNIKHTKNKVYINTQQFFDNIPKDVWFFYVGDYQVLDKWLRDRKDRQLSYKEIETFIKIVNVISETIKIMDDVDAALKV